MISPSPRPRESSLMEVGSFMQAHRAGSELDKQSLVSARVICQAIHMHV